MIIINSAGIKTIVREVEGQPDFKSFSDSTVAILQAAYDAGNYEIVSEPEPIAESTTPNWDDFYDQLIVSSVYDYLLSQTIPYPSISGVMAVMGFSIKDGRDDPTNVNRLAAFQASIYAVLMALNAVGIPLNNEQLTEVRSLLDDNGFSSIQLQ